MDGFFRARKRAGEWGAGERVIGTKVQADGRPCHFWRSGVNLCMHAKGEKAGQREQLVLVL